jgi:glycosyltransferase involved in cell wall biosynthesis
MEKGEHNLNISGASVVTTTWNEKENIGKLVPLIRNVLKDVEHEIIVVDDDSNDGTFEAAEGSLTQL